MGKKFGTRFVWGTGGDEGEGLIGLEKMFLNPTQYNCLPYKNRFNKKEETQYTGYFVPAYTCMIAYMDDRGVTDEVNARKYYENQRKLKAGDPQNLMEYCAEYCFYPDEALSKQGDNNFNQLKIIDQLSEVKIHKSTPEVEVGRLEWIREGNKRTGVRWIPDNKGDIHVVEHPIRVNNLIPTNLYISGIDSIDHGSKNSVVGEAGSKFAILVKKRTFGIDQGDKYVCYYKNRPADEREAYDQALRILYYYNSKVNLEDTKTNIISYFRAMGDYDRLIKRPQQALSNQSSRNKTNLIGTPGSEKMIIHGLNLIANYVEDHCHMIFFEELLEELQKYSFNNKTVFDLIAAMQMCEVYDESLGNKPVTQKAKQEWQDIGWYVDPATGFKKWGPIPTSKFNIKREDIDTIEYIDQHEGKVVRSSDMLL